PVASVVDPHAQNADVDDLHTASSIVSLARGLAAGPDAWRGSSHPPGGPLAPVARTPSVGSRTQARSTARPVDARAVVRPAARSRGRGSQAAAAASGAGRSRAGPRWPPRPRR